MTEKIANQQAKSISTSGLFVPYSALPVLLIFLLILWFGAYQTGELMMRLTELSEPACSYYEPPSAGLSK